MRSWSERRLAVLVSLVLAAAELSAQKQPPAAAVEPFTSGIAARNDKRWKEAATFFRQAVAADPNESKEKVRGNRRFRGSIEYLPHFYLGDVLLEDGDCPGALAAWAESERQNVATQLRDQSRRLRSGIERCERTGALAGAKYEAAFEQARAAVREADAAARSFEERRSRAPGDALSPEQKGQAQQANADLAHAKERLDAGSRSRLDKDLADARTSAARARENLFRLGEDLSAFTEKHFAQQLEAVAAEIEIAARLEKAVQARAGGPLPAALDGARAQGAEALKTARANLDAARAGNPAMLAAARSNTVIANESFSAVLRPLDAKDQEEKRQGVAQALQGSKDALAFAAKAVAVYKERAEKRPDLVDQTMQRERRDIEARIQDARRNHEEGVRGNDVALLEKSAQSAQQAVDRLNALIVKFGPRTLEERGVHPALVQGVTQFLNGRYADAVATLLPTGGFAEDLLLKPQVHLFRAASLYALFLLGGSRDTSLLDRAATDVAAAKTLDPGITLDPRAFSPRFRQWFREVAAPQVSQLGASR
jgi:hypothetical protein